MAPRITKSTFKGCEGFPTIKQDHLALQRCILIGAILADREAFRVGRPGMGTLDFHLIDDEVEKDQYKKVVTTLKKILRTPSSQLKELDILWEKFNLNKEWVTDKHVEAIQERLRGHYRIILFNYHSRSGLCTLSWAGDDVSAKNICLITDGEKWDVSSKTSGVYEGEHFCRGCLKVSHSLSSHRCKYTCTSCNSLLANGNCKGELNRKCTDCSFIFQTEKCYQVHKFESHPGRGSRCDALKYCDTCRSIYKPSRGAHSCDDYNIYCPMCCEYTKNEHECTWAPFSDKKRAMMEKLQDEAALAFYDIETDQADLNPDGTFHYREHYARAINLKKSCRLCEDRPVSEHCVKCHVREVRFAYDPNNAETEDNYKVVIDFCKYLISDTTLHGRSIFAHNGGRFDSHLVIEGFRRLGMVPSSIVNKGSTVIKAIFKMRGRKNIILKDSYCIIPMALGQFNKAFELNCEEKGTFPHLANTRENWGRVWPSLPDRLFYGYDNKKPDEQMQFDVWYESQKGMEWNQDEALAEYCSNDVTILMLGCLKFDKIIREQTGWSPLIVANTLPSFVLLDLRSNYLNHKDFPYLPEAGYGAVNQSDIGIRYFKWLEKKYPNRKYQHAHSPHGEKRVRVNFKNYHVDCLEDDKKIYEFYGCRFHGCPRCFMDGEMLAGGETAGELYRRTKFREEQLRSKYEVEVKWECQLRLEIAADPVMKQHFKEVEVINRLQPRDALYGGRVEVFRPYLKATEVEAIKYYDIVSMYPYVQAMMPFPLGHPKVITSGFQPVTGHKLPYRGLIKLRILAPQNLKIAILPIKHDDYLFFGLCDACIKNSIERCTHNDERERAWVGTYCTEEVEEALKHRYRILDIFEVWTWERFDDKVYRKYFKKVMKMKFAASGFPAEVVTVQEKADYCKRVGAKLGFTLDPKEVVRSEAKRSVAKLMANSAWGKLAEVPTHTRTEYMTIEELYKLKLDASRVLVDVIPLDSESEFLLVTHRPAKDTIRANRFSSVHHAAYVTCYARLLLHKLINTVSKTAAYCDTDSIVFTMPREGVDPLAHMLTGEFGELSDEMKDGWEIIEAVFAGCKNYSMLMENKATGGTGRKLASRGFTKDANTLKILNHDTIRSMVVNKDDPHTPKDLNVSRVELKRTMGGSVRSVPTTKRYRPVSKKRATRGEGEDEIKVPFGYVDSD